MTADGGTTRQRAFVTGGAGFIGASVVRRLLERGHDVTVYDDLSTSEHDWAEPFADAVAQERMRFVRGDVADLDAVVAALDEIDLVVHLAGNTDIRGGHVDPAPDWRRTILGTWVVAEAMRRTGVGQLMFASSGVVYGTTDGLPTDESYGPLLPASHYAAGKLAGEAILSGFAHLYGWRALGFRFANTVGEASNHGVVNDFVAKLCRDPTRLQILGDGTQSKPYIDVEDLVDGMLCAADGAPRRPFAVYNIATDGTVPVRRVAEIVVESLGLRPERVRFEFTSTAGDGGGWPGDTPHVRLDSSALRALGWKPRLNAEEAIRRAAEGAVIRAGASAPVGTA